MMHLQGRIKAFAALGSALRGLLGNQSSAQSAIVEQQQERFDAAIVQARIHNNWFTEAFSRDAFSAIADELTEEKLTAWLAKYPTLEADRPQQTVAIIMAGNIPLVGFHDLMCVLLAGHNVLIKTSADDTKLTAFVCDLLIQLEPALEPMIAIVSGKMEGMDAVIATGSNNTSRYFEHYFGKYPNIIRKNRTSVAVLTGNETREELELLGKDIFQYFGLGCRTVSKLFIPAGMKLDTIFEALYPYKWVVDNNKYGNNYDYNRAIWLMERVDFLDNGFFLLKEDKALASPAASAYYEYYADINTVLDRLNEERDNIQCIVSSNDIPFGQAQQPGLADYADGIDTLAWLAAL